MAVGQPVLIADHLNLTARSPLVGAAVRRPDRPLLGPAAPAGQRDRPDRSTEGVYAALPGPHYETPAEIRMLRTLGADLVGMSTALEAIAARAEGVEVLGLSLVTNLAAGITGERARPRRGARGGQAAATRMGGLLADVIGHCERERRGREPCGSSSTAGATFGAHPQARPGAGRRVLVTGAAGRIGRAACPGLRGPRLGGARPGPRPARRRDGLADAPVVADVARRRRAGPGDVRGGRRSCTWPASSREAPFADDPRRQHRRDVPGASTRPGAPASAASSSPAATTRSASPPAPSWPRVDLPPRPDTYYGVSKVVRRGARPALRRPVRDGGRLPADRLAVPDRPTTPRHLSTWLSPSDGIRLLARGADRAGRRLRRRVRDVSANTRGWWDLRPGPRARATGRSTTPRTTRRRCSPSTASPTRPTRSNALLGGDFAGPEYDADRLRAAERRRERGRAGPVDAAAGGRGGLARRGPGPGHPGRAARRCSTRATRTRSRTASPAGSPSAPRGCADRCAPARTG